MTNLVVWFDIPVISMDRAIPFYESVLNCKVKLQNIKDAKVGVLHFDNIDPPGCLWETDQEQPSSAGIMVYLSVQGSLEEALSRVSENGGRIIQPKHSMGAYGYRAIVRDTEGNRVALHSY